MILGSEIYGYLHRSDSPPITILCHVVADTHGLAPSTIIDLFLEFFPKTLFPCLTCHGSILSPYQHNATIITANRPCPKRDAENWVFGHRASRPVRSSLSNPTGPTGEKTSTEPCLSCHVRSPKAQLRARPKLLTSGGPAPTTKSSY